MYKFEKKRHTYVSYTRDGDLYTKEMSRYNNTISDFLEKLRIGGYKLLAVIDGFIPLSGWGNDGDINFQYCCYNERDKLYALLKNIASEEFNVIKFDLYELDILKAMVLDEINSHGEEMIFAIYLGYKAIIHDNYIIIWPTDCGIEYGLK